MLAITNAERTNYDRLAGKSTTTSWARDRLNDAVRRRERARSKRHLRLVEMIDAITDESILTTLTGVIAAFTTTDGDD